MEVTKITNQEVIEQFRKSLRQIVFNAVRQSWLTDQAPALEQPDGRTEMKTYEIKIRTHEAWETPDGNLRVSNVKAERIIDVNSFEDALDYVHENFDAEGVTITSLKIKEIS